MRLWRISNYANLDGAGGLVSSGRWHTRGREVVYLAESPAGALLECLVHLEIDPDDIPSSYQLLTIDIPDGLAAEAIEASTLPADWSNNEIATRAVGDRWLANGHTSLIQVPCVVVPYTSNWLLNPRHPDAAKAKITDVTRALFDHRLFG